MRVTLLAKRYAQALFELALEKKILEEVSKDMILVEEVINSSKELRLLLNNPVIDAHKKTAVMEKIFKGNIEELSLKFILLIARKGREKYIPYISKAFNGIYKDYKNIVDVTFTTAYKSDKSVKDGVLKVLEKVTEKNVELQELIDEDIIGGYIFNLEDYQYDASVKTELKRMKKEFSKNLFIKKY
ncbi:MAG: ATP synthase F1 subunit delta [Marinilabiliales bacterium]|nr:MAG: ATP synthase F1 subunit delta [Marinilabiliales bacterium]